MKISYEAIETKGPDFGEIISGAAASAGALEKLELQVAMVGAELAKLDRAARVAGIEKMGEGAGKQSALLKLQRDDASANLKLMQDAKNKATAEAESKAKAAKVHDLAESKSLDKLKEESKRKTEKANEKNQAEATRKVEESSKEQAAALNSVASTALNMAAAVGTAVLSLAKAGAEYALQAARFKEDTTIAFSSMLGGAKEGTKAFAMAQNIARTLGESASEVAGQLKEALSKGVSEDNAERIVHMVADLRASGNKGANVSQITDTLQALQKRGGALTPEMFAPLTAINKSKVYETLAAKLGVTTKNEQERFVQVDKRMAKLKGQKGIDAFQDVFKAITGKENAGDKAKEVNESTLTGSIQMVKNSVEDLFTTLNTSGPGKILVAQLQAVASAINPTSESGAQLKAALEEAASAAGGLLKQINMKEAIVTFRGLVGVVRTLMPYFSALGGGLLAGVGAALRPIFEALGGAGGKVEPMAMLVDGLRSLGETLGFVIGVGALAIAAIVGIFTTGFAVVGGAVASAGVAALSLAAGIADLVSTGFEAIGEAIPDGIKKGIVAKWEELKGTLTGLVSGLEPVVRKLLDTHSPSKVFARIGVDTVAGFTQGVEGEGALAQDAVMSVVSPKMLGVGAGAQGGAAARGGMSVTNHIEINGATDPAAVRQAAEEGATAGTMKVFELLGLESGSVGPVP